MLENITLGGVQQWFTVPGATDSLPVLLFLHGGPGSPQTGGRAFLQICDGNKLRRPITVKQ